MLKRTCAALLLPMALAACSGGAHRRPTAAPSTPAPTSTPTPAPSVAPAFALTGMPVTDPRLAARPALSVKIDNLQAALPQSGLNQADLVADVLVEGGLTRLLATYQSHDASQIGPIRSARPVDADLLRQLGGGIFAYSGADKREIAPVKARSHALLLANDDTTPWFFRSAARRAPHNLFSSTDRLYAAGRHLRPGLTPPPALFAFGARAPQGQPVTTARIPFSRFSVAGWTYADGRYLRSQNGAPDVLAGGERISATNVVIMSVAWKPTRIIDDAGNADPYVIVVGTGQLWVLRNGVVVHGHWARSSSSASTRLLDDSGRVIPLAPGRTWLELQPRPFLPTLR